MRQGAHAMFLPHGLGHMMGMDVHDMEALDQIYVGFDEETRPNLEQFGTNCLRMGRRLQEGFVVTDEPGRTVMEMTLKEGKNREIRRMCEAVGLEVIRLKRNAEGVVKLGMLQPGKYRELTKAEVNGLRAAAAKGRAQTRSAALQSKAAARRPRGPVGGNKAAAGKKHK